MWRRDLFVCKHPEPVRMGECQRNCKQEKRAPNRRLVRQGETDKKKLDVAGQRTTGTDGAVQKERVNKRKIDAREPLVAAGSWPM